VWGRQAATVGREVVRRHMGQRPSGGDATRRCRHVSFPFLTVLIFTFSPTRSVGHSWVCSPLQIWGTTSSAIWAHAQMRLLDCAMVSPRRLTTMVTMAWRLLGPATRNGNAPHPCRLASPCFAPPPLQPRIPPSTQVSDRDQVGRFLPLATVAELRRTMLRTPILLQSLVSWDFASHPRSLHISYVVLCTLIFSYAFA
jgi:hypothetical protein